MSDTKENIRASSSFNEKSKEEQANYDTTRSSRDWKEERNKNIERAPNRDSDTYKYENRDRDKERDPRDPERNRERDRNRQRSPQRRNYRSPVRSGPKSPDREREFRRDKPREREERGRGEQREGARLRERSHGRERRRSLERLDRNESRYGKEVDRSRSSPPSRGVREGYHGKDNSERDPWRRERSREPDVSYSKRSPFRERKYSTQPGGEYHREHSPHNRARSPHYRGRPLEESSPRRRSPLYREYQRRNSPSFRGASPQRRGSPGRGAFGKEAFSRPLDRHRSPPPISSYNTRGNNNFPLNYAFREEGLFESKERDSPEGEFGRTLYPSNLNAPRSKAVARNVYDRLAFSSKEDTITNKYSNSSETADTRKAGSSTNRHSRANQHYPGNTVSTLRDLSDRPMKRDRGEEPPPPPAEPSESWVEEKRARLRSRVEAEEILDMELIILSEKQREYAEKVEQRIKHMGVTTSLITLPPSMGVAEALDSAVRRNLLYAIIILPQHEQHNSITLTILHGRNPQEHKNMPLEDSLCLINIDHQKYEEAIRDRVIQSREVAPEERTTRDPALSPHSTPEKPSLDLEQFSEIIKRFPPTKSDLNKNSKDLQAKILGLLGSSAIFPSTTEDSQEPTQLPLSPDPTMSLHNVTSPLTHFGKMPGYHPTMLPPPNLMYTFPHPFNLPTGPISPLHFQPHGPYMHHPAMLGHPPPFPAGFHPRH